MISLLEIRNGEVIPPKYYPNLARVGYTPRKRGIPHLDGHTAVLVIKDDILIHGKGRDHNDKLKASLGRLYDYGIRLRREKCKQVSKQ